MTRDVIAFTPQMPDVKTLLAAPGRVSSRDQAVV
jgi:hypothetical protein